MIKSKVQCKILGHKIATFEKWNNKDNVIEGYCKRCELWKSHWQSSSV